MSQNQIIEFSAPGKTILSGEHSVVYSKNALAMAIDLRTHEKILKTMQNYQLNILSISKLPISKGLGSSASFNVALSASLFNMIDFLSGEQLKIDQQNFQNFQDLVNKISFDLEKIYHGNPSGIDNYIATYGGLVIFNRAKQQHKGIQSFNLPYKIYLIDSLVEKNTKKAVEKVSEIYHQENLKDIGQPAIQLIEHCTNKIIQILKDQSPKQQDEDIENAEQIYYQFGNLINMNQCLLKMFCLSNYQIEQINMISMKYNIPSKITGAGQGGYCLAFVPKKINKEQEQHFLDEIIQNGFTYMRADCASEGLKDDSK
ncbi:Ribosomal protein S5 domain 2-type fold [Pseudocohnilembus persalinus]|uniref:mevalonate kinase n=1 Tax=Pseudocohnilembus persalinus TaxID=266149 RepID=A0A0V0QSC7_PSEPJ|nr:Ribosomal protein S5 domain 2-type fold [Pseudocohnilembus persalinus]|eukprot:KRX05108.1 Ribosomal protein S5 domain 2-type fold [Pseudocohnilembus persalinus]